jgi:protein O-GlcNAc transferase
MINPPLTDLDHIEPATLIQQAQQAYDYADHARARACYARLLQRYPDHPVIRRNALLSLEYDPKATPAERLAAARDWGQWVTQGIDIPRPAARPLLNRPLRVGYVSADICQHTVGWLIKEVLMAHNPDRVLPFVYSAGHHEDWVTRKIARATQFRDVQAMDDVALAEQIRADQIDVLVDLSGHTAGSRLSAFALRPAPAQVSWLGYFATTGLSSIDAVLLDAWHHTPDIVASFCEDLFDLPSRFCFQPAPFAPEVTPPPVLERGYITFGSFNNTAKLNQAVLNLWARVLAACPASRLVLKWRTLNDPVLRDKMIQTFQAAGISPERLKFRGASFHADVLKEYADIDIALDPFPFCGGLTTCEALWMGVPVITHPQDRAVSRQSSSILNLINHPEWIAQNPEDYVSIAQKLAQNPAQLAAIRRQLRPNMQASALMNVTRFVDQLESTLTAAYGRYAGNVITA